jgi:DNA-binding MarR family transcriptional regulator
MTKPMELTPKQRRRGLDFAEQVAALAGEALDATTKKELYSVVHSIRKRYGYSEAEKEREILRKLALGASSVSDLIRETFIVQPDVWRLTKKLEEEGLIRSEMISATGNGRPILLFFLVDK